MRIDLLLLVAIASSIIFNNCSLKREDMKIEKLELIETKEIYKEINSSKLHLYIFEPSGLRTEDRLPSIIFFHGGAFRKGSPKQFYPHCRYFASRGMVAVSAEYRLLKKNASSILDSIADGKSAIRWLRGHAGRFGIDPDRIVASGGSAGGFLAASTAILDGFDEKAEDSSISSKPNALVLFNPTVNPLRWDERVSQMHYIKDDAPPTIIFHGTADTVVPMDLVRAFAEKMQNSGNICELVSFEGKPHAFFNYGKFDNRPYFDTVTATDLFLSELGYLSGESTLRYDDVGPKRIEKDPRDEHK